MTPRHEPPEGGGWDLILTDPNSNRYKELQAHREKFLAERGIESMKAGIGLTPDQAGAVYRYYEAEIKQLKEQLFTATYREDMGR